MNVWSRNLWKLLPKQLSGLFLHAKPVCYFVVEYIYVIFCRKLAPEFKPTKLHEKRKTHPIFVDDAKPKSARKKVCHVFLFLIQDFAHTGYRTINLKFWCPLFFQSPSRVAYNPLDKKADILKDTEKTRKYPFSRENTTTAAGEGMLSVKSACASVSASISWGSLNCYMTRLCNNVTIIWRFQRWENHT